ncbi:MAG TPA: hypothetical protein VKY73_14575 [Polyangiaceae bacterium]|nr:hypothetical protein [Polyangiaceae bacterium]
MLDTRLARYAALGFLTTLGLASCGGDDKPANTGQPAAVQCPPGQYFDGQMCQNPGAAPGQPVATATATTPQTAPPVVAPPVATSAPGTPAAPVDASAVVPLLTPLVQQYAPGAQAVGTPIAGNFQQGQTLEAQVQMNPGKCYTVVGVAAPTVQNLDIELVPLMPMPGLASPVMAADQTQGPTAVVGAAPNCFKWALPVGGPMKVVVRVSAGQGLAGAQVYEK